MYTPLKVRYLLIGVLLFFISFFLYKQAAANALNNSNYGDLFVPNNAYAAMIDALIGITTDTTSGRSYTRDFRQLCSASVDASVSSGCAVFAMNLVGGDNRDISNYFYQVR